MGLGGWRLRSVTWLPQSRRAARQPFWQRRGDQTFVNMNVDMVKPELYCDDVTDKADSEKQWLVFIIQKICGQSKNSQFKMASWD